MTKIAVHSEFNRSMWVSSQSSRDEITKICDSSSDFTGATDESDDWGFVPSDPDKEEYSTWVELSKNVCATDDKSKSICKSISTPILSNCLSVPNSPSSQQNTTSAAPLTLTRRVPSFKDAILLNAEETRKEQKNSVQIRKQLELKNRQEAIQRRKRSKPKIIVTPIKCSSKSTNDLTGLMSVYEDDNMSSTAGGGSIFSPMTAKDDEEPMGETDAMEFYNRKAMGWKGRANSLKIRPDEAKRKEIIMNKKDMQRKNQREREAR